MRGAAAALARHWLCFASIRRQRRRRRRQLSNIWPMRLPALAARRRLGGSAPWKKSLAAAAKRRSDGAGSWASACDRRRSGPAPPVRRLVRKERDELEQPLLRRAERDPTSPVAHSTLALDDDQEAYRSHAHQVRWARTLSGTEQWAVGCISLRVRSCDTRPKGSNRDTAQPTPSSRYACPRLSSAHVRTK